MNRRRLLRLLSGGAVLALGSAVAGCARPDDRPYASAPASAYDPYGYYYYPGQNVYYHPYSGHYFYNYDNRWRRSRDLPRGVRVDQRDGRRLEYRGERPYDRNREHREQVYRRNEAARAAPDRTRQRQNRTSTEAAVQRRRREDPGGAQTARRQEIRQAPTRQGANRSPNRGGGGGGGGNEAARRRRLREELSDRVD